MKGRIIAELVAKVARLEEQQNIGEELSDKVELLKLSVCLLDDIDLTFKDSFQTTMKFH